MSAPKERFEWLGKGFSTREGLRDLLALGVFKEGDAWGSIRQGWAPVAPWREVLRAFDESGAVRGGGAIPRAGLPAQALAGDLTQEGSRVWSVWGAERALDRLWSMCEGHLLQASSKAPKAKKKSSRRL